MSRLLLALLGLLVLCCCSPDPRKEADKLYDAMDYAGAARAYAPLAGKDTSLEFRKRYALSLARTGKAAEAEPLLAQILQTSPDPAIAGDWLDCLALVKGVDEAWKVGQDLIKKYPDSAPVHRALGTLAAQRGDRTSAGMHLERALALDPNQAAAYSVQGDLRLRDGDLTGAMERYQLAVNAEPRGPMSVRVRVRMAQIVEDVHPEQAIPILQEAAAVQPGSPEVSAEIGKVMASQGLYEECIQYLKEAYDAKLERPDVVSTLGFCFLQRGMGSSDAGSQRQDLLAAKMWLNRLMVKDSTYRGARNNLGKVLARLGDTEQAEQAFRQELNLYPDSVEALTNLGRLLAEQGEQEKARDLLAKAFEIDRRHSALAAELGRMVMLQGDWDAALVWYQTAWKLCQDEGLEHPCRLDVPFQLARIAGHRREKEAAVKYFMTAVQAGFSDMNRFKAESDLKIIQDDPRVAQLMSAFPQ